MVELVMVIVILGVLAAVAIPRMSGLSDFKVLAFHDQVVAALRHGQKSATSHRRLVCATFTATTLSLRIANNNPQSTCDTDLTLPAGGTSVQSGDTTNAVFSPVPAALFFQPDGRGTSDGAGTTVVSPNLTITGQTPITVVGATGHVQ
jgi:type II secretory pathway pseudopilin PulG